MLYPGVKMCVCDDTCTYCVKNYNSVVKMCILFYREKEENKPTKPAKYVYGCLAEIAASVYSPLFTDWPVSDGLYQHMDRES